MKMTKTSYANFFALLLFAVFIMSLAAPAVMAQGSDFIPDSTYDVAQADTEMPSDVENLAAEAGDAMVHLSWDVATDNDLVAGYKIYYGTASVTADGGEYNLGTIDANNVIEYDVTGLVNDTPYYFAVTAYDSSANESENYSYEVSSTPVGGSADAVAPTVAQAEALDRYTVLVTFSEMVVLPSIDSASAFTIVEDGTGLALDVLSASMNLNDDSSKSVLLTTGSQTAGTNYILTAGIQVMDVAGNPIESGTSDTALFNGTEQEPASFGAADETVAAGDTEPPMVVSAQATDATHVVVRFSEPVNLGLDPASNFIISEEGNFSSMLDILNAELDLDDQTVFLTTSTQSAVSYNLITQDTVMDITGNSLEPAKNAIVFIGMTGIVDPVDPVDPVFAADPGTDDGLDTNPPEDATNLAAKLLEGMVVGLTWTPSINTASDLANYVLYKSTDGSTYVDGVILDSTAKAFNISSLKPGMKHYFKLAAKDTAGNESTGVMTSLVLPGTGPELALIGLASLGLGRVFRKKSKKNTRK